MSIQVNDKNLGHATAYAYAVAGGYTGTEAEFTELLGNIADDLGQIENLTVTVETLAAGSSATASYSNGVLHLGIPKGDKGDGAYHVEPSGESFVIHTDADGIVTSAQEIRISINAKQGTSAMVISSVTGLPNISLAGGGNIAPEILKNAFTGSVATIIYTIPVNSQITAEQINAQYIARVNNGTPNGYGISCSLSVAVVKDGAKGDTGATGSTGPTGNGIASVAKTGTSGLVDTYTITYTNGNTSTFTVTNGAEAVDNTLTIAGRAADAKKTGDEISELKEDLNYIGNWGTFTKGSGSVAVPFEFIQGHKYTVINKSVSGAINFNLADTPTGSALQTIYGLDAGVTKTFIANQNAHYINGWQASSQTFFIIDNSSKVIEWDNYQNQIDDMLMLKTPYDLTEGGFIETDGTISQNQYYSYTDFIDCSEFGRLRVVSPNGSLNFCAWYKEDKTTAQRFTVPQGDTTLIVPDGYKYARLSAGTNDIAGMSVYTGLWFNGAITREYLDGIKDLLPNRYVATRITAGITDYFDYKVVKGHSYLLVNPNGFACSFTPKSADGTDPEIGATTISPNSVNMRVSEVDGYCNCYFAGDNGTLYIYDMDGESIRKTITDLNGDAVDAIVSSRYKNSANPHLLTLVHFSDIHADPTSLRRIINFDSDMSEYIDDVICTGDIVSSKFGDSLDFWTSSDGAEKILTCVGNHDSYATNSMDSDQMVSMSDIASKFIVPFESDWGAISRPTGCTYYYKDYDSGYRLVVLDSIRVDAEATAEATWLTNVLADAKTNNLAVIIAMHYMPTGAMHILDCQFSKYGTAGDSGIICNAPNFDVQGIVQDFIDDGGTFMCYLIGHLHRDIFGYVYGYSKQPCIMITTSNATKASQEINADLGRVLGTKMQDAFNAVTFDKDSGIIKVIRVGADVDNVMRPRKAISYIIQSGTFPMN